MLISPRQRAAAAAILAAAALASVVPLELVAAQEPAATVPGNSSFEIDADGDAVPDGWTQAGYGRNRAKWRRVTDARTGRYAHRVDISSLSSGDRKLLTDFSTPIPVRPGDRLDLSAWYQTDGSAHLLAFHRDGAGRWQYWSGSPALVRSSSWRQASWTTPPVPEGTTGVSFGLNLRSTGRLLLDDLDAAIRDDGTTTTTAALATTTSTTTSAPSTTTTTAPSTTTTTTTPSADATVLLRDDFARPDGVVTNEYAHWNPTSPTARHDATWQMGSGSLFTRDGAGWTGVPDDRTPDATSSTGNNSAIFRLVTKRADFGDVDVRFKLRHEAYVTTPSTPAAAWDGVHVFLRHRDEENLYYASVNRRDGGVAIKKKVSGGPSNGGTYHTLATGKRTVRAGAWEDVRASVQDNADGSVTIELWVDGSRAIAAVDAGTGGAPIRTGQVGIRGDNSQFSFDDLIVSQR